jgi:hypothetical protein
LNDDVSKAFKSLAELAEVLDETNYVLEIPIFKHFTNLVLEKEQYLLKR